MKLSVPPAVPSSSGAPRPPCPSTSSREREGRRRHGRDRIHLWRVAAGSADEVVASLRVAEAWGHVDAASIAPALGLCDRVLAMLWRLTH